MAFVVLVSTLSAHTKEMLEDPNVALMIMEPESDTKPPHTLARVSMQGRAEPISQDDRRFGAARAAYTARFPDMVGLFELSDFTLFAIAPIGNPPSPTCVDSPPSRCARRKTSSRSTTAK